MEKKAHPAWAKGLATILIFAAAIACIALAFSEDDSPMGIWLPTHLGLAALGLALFRVAFALEEIWMAEAPRKKEEDTMLSPKK